MPVSKRLFFFFMVAVVFLFFPKIVFAQVVINEFSSRNDTDWVEVYNASSEPVDLSEYQLIDDGGNSQDLNCQLSPSGEFSVDWSNRLNNDGDQIILQKNGETIDCIAYGDTVFCEGRSDVDLRELEEGEYGMRDPAGSGSWTIKNANTKADNSDCIILTPTPTITLTPTQSPTNTPTPTNTPSPSKATYKINEVKDDDGNVLSNAKVYVNGVYVHHYAPEELTFCDDCKCDTDVDCGFGEYTIKLEKSGYQDWIETKTINARDSHEVNPVMNKSSSTSSPTSTPTKTPIPTKKLTSNPTLTKSVSQLSKKETTLSGEILGEKATRSVHLIKFPQATEDGSLISTPSGLKRAAAGTFILLGGLSILGAGTLLFKKKYF